MTESNGKNGSNLVHVSPDVERLLEKGRTRRAVEASIEDALVDVINVLAVDHPNHLELIAAKLEGYANKIRGDIEARKRKDRERGRRY
jgi:hypothetical protein